MTYRVAVFHPPTITNRGRPCMLEKAQVLCNTIINMVACNTSKQKEDHMSPTSDTHSYYPRVYYKVY